MPERKRHEAQRTCTLSLESNGRADGHNKTFMDMARLLLYAPHDAEFNQICADAIRSASYIGNQLMTNIYAGRRTTLKVLKAFNLS